MKSCCKECPWKVRNNNNNVWRNNKHIRGFFVYMLELLYYIAERLASDTTEGGNNTTEHITRLHHLSLSTTIDTTIIIFIHHLV